MFERIPKWSHLDLRWDLEKILNVNSITLIGEISIPVWLTLVHSQLHKAKINNKDNKD